MTNRTKGNNMAQKKDDFMGSYRRPMSDDQKRKIFACSKVLDVPNPLLERGEHEVISMPDATSMIHPFDDIMKHKRLTREEYLDDLRYCETQKKVVHMDDVIKPGDPILEVVPEPKQKGRTYTRFSNEPYRFKTDTVEATIELRAVQGKEFNSLKVLDWMMDEDYDKWLTAFNGDEVAAAKDVSNVVNEISHSGSIVVEQIKGKNQRYIYHPDGLPEAAPEPIEAPEEPIVTPELPAQYTLIGHTPKGRAIYSFDGKIGVLEFTELDL